MKRSVKLILSILAMAVLCAALLLTADAVSASPDSCFTGTDAFWGAADDAHKAAVLERFGPERRFVGVFSLRGEPAALAVPLENGDYVNLIDERPVAVRGGKLRCEGRPLILSAPRR